MAPLTGWPGPSLSSHRSFSGWPWMLTRDGVHLPVAQPRGTSPARKLDIQSLKFGEQSVPRSIKPSVCTLSSLRTTGPTDTRLLPRGSDSARQGPRAQRDCVRAAGCAWAPAALPRCQPPRLLPARETQSCPAFLSVFYGNSGGPAAESEFCVSAAWGLWGLAHLKSVLTMQTHVAARKPHGSPVGKAAARRRGGQTEIYSSDLGLVRPGDRVPSEPPLTHPSAWPDRVDHEMQKRSGGGSLSRRSILDSTLGASLQQQTLVPQQHYRKRLSRLHSVDAPTPTRPRAVFRAAGRPSEGPWPLRASSGRAQLLGGGQAWERLSRLRGKTSKTGPRRQAGCTLPRPGRSHGLAAAPPQAEEGTSPSACPVRS